MFPGDSVNAVFVEIKPSNLMAWVDYVKAGVRAEKKGYRHGDEKGIHFKVIIKNPKLLS